MNEYKWVLEILFSGFGTAIIAYLFFKKTNRNVVNQKQKSGTKSVNIQVGRDVKIKSKGNSDGQN